jgi:hypothetical protein
MESNKDKNNTFEDDINNRVVSGSMANHQSMTEGMPGHIHDNEGESKQVSSQAQVNISGSFKAGEMIKKMNSNASSDDLVNNTGDDMETSQQGDADAATG